MKRFIALLPMLATCLWLVGAIPTGGVRHTVDRKLGNGESFVCVADSTDGHIVSQAFEFALTLKRSVDFSFVISGGVANSYKVKIGYRAPEDELLGKPSALTANVMVDDTEIAEGDLPEIKIPGKIFFKITLTGADIIVEAGNDKLLHLISAPYAGECRSISIIANRMLTIDQYVQWLNITPIPQTTELIDVEQINRWNSEHPAVYSGVYRFLDETVDPKVAVAGGEYRLGVVSDPESGGYLLIYLGGGVGIASTWEPGAIKGRLTSTPFRNNFDLIWYDAEGRAITRGANATFEGRILTVNLPLQSATLRFARI